jgi:hypothetical protein
MGAIPLCEVQPGMVLERDVVVPPDRLLMQGGVELTISHLRLLHTWGVGEVSVQGVSRAYLLEQAAGAVGGGKLAAVQADIDDLFHHTDPAHPAIEELIYLATLWTLRQSTEHRGSPG